jgi:hypothetical protein
MQTKVILVKEDDDTYHKFKFRVRSYSFKFKDFRIRDPFSCPGYVCQNRGTTTLKIAAPINQGDPVPFGTASNKRLMQVSNPHSILKSRTQKF